MAKGPPKVRDAALQVHGDSAVGRINAKVGLRITVILGTMWAAYIFAAIAPGTCGRFEVRGHLQGHRGCP